ncbi:heterokaryon incompatibility, partial [Phaeosphaeriaceae sp. PMI808]
RYVTLSYVWGKSKPFLLTQDMYLKLIQPGALKLHFQNIPRTIRDSVSFCRSIGERYLWVDSICIIQDNSEDKRNQIGSMDSIYANSSFTIVAAEGNSSEAGLAGVSTLRPSQASTWINDMELITVFNDVESIVEDAVWNTRAWTFQEQRLSHRKLFFTRQQIYFECGT